MRARHLLQVGSSGVVFATMLLVGSVVFWIGVPLAWLWIAAQIFYLSDSAGLAMGASLLGAILTIAALVQVLDLLSRTHGYLREARGLPPTGPVALEAVLVVGATVGLAVFMVWFLFWGMPSTVENVSP